MPGPPAGSAMPHAPHAHQQQPYPYQQPQPYQQPHQQPYQQQQPQPYQQQQPQPYPQQQPQPYQQPHQQYQQPQPYPHPGAQPYPSPQQPPSPQAAQQPQAPRPNLDHLGYSDKLAIPEACCCCMGPAQTTAETDQIQTGTRRYAWFRFPYCKRCKWHITWSGRFKTGIVGSIGYLMFGAGMVGGVALGLKDGAEGKGNAIVYALLLGAAGYLALMLLVALFGLLVAPRKPECTCRGAAVRIRRGAGSWHFRFTNPTFEDQFRAMNRGR
jgi:hypothetical protein